MNAKIAKGSKGERKTERRGREGHAEAQRRGEGVEEPHCAGDGEYGHPEGCLREVRWGLGVWLVREDWL